MAKWISVFGPSQSCENVYATAVSVGKILAEQGAATVTGGYGGVMKGAHFGALCRLGHTVGIHLGKLVPWKLNPHIIESVDCSTFQGHFLPLEAALGLRRVRLLQSEGFVFLAGGKLGTMDELLGVLGISSLLTLKERKRFALLDVQGELSWGRWIELFDLQGLPVNELSHCFIITSDPKEAVCWALDR